MELGLLWDEELGMYYLRFMYLISQNVYERSVRLAPGERNMHNVYAHLEWVFCVESVCHGDE